MTYTKHIAGEMADGVQRCVICGFVIADYRHTMVEEGSPPLRGWQEGEVFVSDSSNPKVFTTMLPPEEVFVNCEMD